MNGFLRGTLWAAMLFAALSGIALALAGCGGGGDSSNPPGASAPTVVVQTLPLPGPYAVACSNVVQDFSRVGAGEDVTSYWEGSAVGRRHAALCDRSAGGPGEYADRHGDRAAGPESLRVVCRG